jgi:hypothetical protein
MDLVSGLPGSPNPRFRGFGDRCTTCFHALEHSKVAFWWHEKLQILVGPDCGRQYGKMADS